MNKHETNPEDIHISTVEESDRQKVVHTADSPKKTRAAYLSAHDRRSVLLRSSLKLLQQTPVSSLTPAAVCTDAGCVRSLFYHYFADIPQLCRILIADLIDAADQRYHSWAEDGSRRITPRSTMDDVAQLLCETIDPVRNLYQAGNSGLVLDYIDGCRDAFSRDLMQDFVDGIETRHRVEAEDYEGIWSVFFTGLLVRMVGDPRMSARDVRVLLAQAFHVEALLNAF